jgi:Carboxypeptidase regulatory-like domain
MARNFINRLRLLRTCTLTLCIHAFALHASPPTGEVDGRVIGASGEPVQGARVYSLPTESANPGRHVEVLTGPTGGFLLTNVREGQNEIHAYAPEIGYPDNLFAAFQTAPVPVVAVKAGTAIHGIVIHFGPKPGTLAGEVVDDKTRKPLPTASITMSWVDRPEYSVRSSVGQDGRFTFNVPVRPLLISVICPGYQPWKSSPVTVTSGGTFPLVVAMTK